MEEISKWKLWLMNITDKLSCKLGYHTWSISLDKHIEEFGGLKLNDNRIHPESVCSVCGVNYGDKS